ncbi:group I truncated hemoglobin [Sphingomonas abaci]|uniref:Hemoglobin n=1 Tax=Sphingomonas abaci TaxID=237611 RepID=A0A7W7AF87_9SPHN|nr:group 1 truncated hemoglobin [Sphingomonas abaci]MBB4615958.1 hemoglobin [Sphingomonas abaci]
MIASLVALALQTAATSNSAPAPTPAGEEPVAPYAESDANAGAAPFRGDAMWRAFGAAAGVHAIVDDLVARNTADPRITDIFRNRDLVRLRRTLFEQFCYILNGGCHYSGQTMAQSHKDMGIQQADMAALVENLQAAMRGQHVPMAAQNRLLAKLAPMHRPIVAR